MSQNTWRRVLVLSCCSVLAACDLPEVAPVDELEQWISQQKVMAARSVQIDPLPPEHKPARVALVSTLGDLFDQQRSVVKVDDIQKQLGKAALANNPLLQFPLSQITYGGYVVQRGKRVALLRTGQNLYRARIGDLAGTDAGRITYIDEKEVRVVELVLNEIGKRVARERTLPLMVGESNASK